MTMRTDTVPQLLRPFYLAGSFSIAAALYAALIWPQRRTVRFEFEGKEHLTQQPHIGCIWHEDLLPFFIAFHQLDAPQIWMNHPLWYMKPIHYLLRFIGIRELVLGSTGHGGKAAADTLVRRLIQRQVSTTLAVDGPAGPPKLAKKGALHMALQTGFPLVPITFKPHPCAVLPFTWDGKKCPILFGRMRIVCHPPMYVTEDNFGSMNQRLMEALND